jgi:hypothetical protein
MSHPAYDSNHICDRCERHPREFRHLPSEEAIFLVRWCQDGTYFYMCNECMRGYVHSISIIDGREDDTDDEDDECEEDPSPITEDEDPE